MKRHRTKSGRFAKSHKKSHRRRKSNTSKRSLLMSAKASSLASHPKKRKKHSKKSRKAAARYARRASMKHVRPTVLVSRGKYYRPRRSKYFKKATKINGRRRRRNGSSLMSTVKSAFALRSITQYASIGGGLFVGTLLSKLLNTGLVPFTSYSIPTTITETLAKARPAHGLIHILVGSIVAAKSRNKYVKDAAIGLAALGGFDLLMQGLAMAGVKNLPTFSGMNIDLLGMTQYYKPNSSGGVPSVGMNVNLNGPFGYGDAWADECESNHLADNINDMMS